MLTAGVEPLPGHVGRLDLETSGLILVTADSLLLEAALGIPRPGVTDSEAASASLTKTYELLLAGLHDPDSPALRDLGEPLTHQRCGREFHSDAAACVRHLRTFQCGNESFHKCLAIVETPFPYPYAQGTMVMLLLWCLCSPFMVCEIVNNDAYAIFTAGVTSMAFALLNEVRPSVHGPRGNAC